MSNEKFITLNNLKTFTKQLPEINADLKTVGVAEQVQVPCFTIRVGAEDYSITGVQTSTFKKFNSWPEGTAFSDVTVEWLNDPACWSALSVEEAETTYNFNSSDIQTWKETLPNKSFYVRGQFIDTNAWANYNKISQYHWSQLVNEDNKSWYHCEYYVLGNHIYIKELPADHSSSYQAGDLLFSYDEIIDPIKSGLPFALDNIHILINPNYSLEGYFECTVEEYLDSVPAADRQTKTDYVNDKLTALRNKVLTYNQENVAYWERLGADIELVEDNTNFADLQTIKSGNTIYNLPNNSNNLTLEDLLPRMPSNSSGDYILVATADGNGNVSYHWEAK